MRHSFKLPLLLAVASLSFSAETLKIRIDRILGDAKLSQSPLSLQIVDLKNGKILYEKNPTLSLNPASNVKIITAATALRELGPNYTFKTEFYSNSLIDKAGRIKNLWIKGFGDPYFVTEELESVIKRFVVAGLKKIEGGIFVDDTYFDKYHLTTYLSDVHEKVYRVTTGPLSFNWNSIEIQARPGTRKGISDPAAFTGTMIKEALQRERVEIEGGLKREPVPKEALVVMTHRSPPLKTILKGLGKHSNNFVAEQLVKTMSAHHFGPPGTNSKGLSLMQDCLVSLGFHPSHFRLDNGSGLSQISRLSSEQIVKVLVDLYHSPWRNDFISSLSIAGIDGTMVSKMRGSRLKGRVFAKTGTLNNVSALSGYLFDKNRGVAYSFLFNDFPTSLHRMTQVQERILGAVWDTL